MKTLTLKALLDVLIKLAAVIFQGLLWLYALLGFISTSDAQTVICGPITTTTWTPDGNPYIIGCDSTVPSGQTLTIQPGVMVLLGPDVTLTANDSAIHAVGIPGANPANRITFQAPVPSQYWNMIRLSNTRGTNRFKYCDFQNAKTALSIGVYGNYGAFGNNAIRTVYPEIMNCTFSNCLSEAIYGESQAVGVFNQYCPQDTALNALIKNCVFINMSNGCVMKIFGDFSLCNACGGTGHANPQIVANVFQNLSGTAFLMTVGGCAGSSQPIFLNNTIVNCRTGIDTQEPWDARIQNNIFVGTTNAVRKSGSLSLTTSFNDFFGNATNFTGYPPNYGQPFIPNRNGTLADLFFNIFENPQFVSGNNFHLANNSACIDAGTADAAFSDLCLSNSPSLGTQFPDLGAYGGPDACNWLDIVPKLPVTASISKLTNIIRVSWGAIPRSEYQIQYSTNHLCGTNPTPQSVTNWLNVTNGKVLAVAKPTSFNVTTNATNISKEFFRIQSLGRTPGN